MAIMKFTVRLLSALCGAVSVLAGACAQDSPRSVSGKKPNIIVFLVDNMGWQDTSLPFWTDEHGAGQDVSEQALPSAEYGEARPGHDVYGCLRAPPSARRLASA